MKALAPTNQKIWPRKCIKVLERRQNSKVKVQRVNVIVSNNGLQQIPSKNQKVRTITSKFHQNPTIPSEDNMLKTLSQSDTMQAH
jgi:hypothetical protein